MAESLSMAQIPSKTREWQLAHSSSEPSCESDDESSASSASESWGSVDSNASEKVSACFRTDTYIDVPRASLTKARNAACTTSKLA
jgi:hypothetical protein